MTFNDPAFDFIPWAKPLSDPRKASISVKQLLNHTSGICPEATGAPNDGSWQYVLGHSGDARTAKLAFDPGTACGYSTHALCHAALVCENVTGKPYDQFAVEALFKPLGIAGSILTGERGGTWRQRLYQQRKPEPWEGRDCVIREVQLKTVQAVPNTALRNFSFGPPLVS